MIKKRQWVIPILLLMLLPALEVHAESSQTVQSSTVLNIREGPSLEDAIKGQMEIGTNYTVVTDNGDWLKIDMGNGQVGWVAAYLVTKSDGSTESGEATVSTVSEGSSGTITEGGIRLRKGPGTDYQVITTLSKEMTVTILSNDGNWTKIQSPSGTGWVNSEYISSATTQAPDEVSQDDTTAVVSENNINVRDTASLNGEVIGKLAEGTVIHIVAENGDWVKIQFSGNTGWVYKSLLQEEGEVESTSSTSNQTIDTSVTILHDGTNIRSDASANASVLLVAAKGQSYQATEEVGDWYKIELDSGDTGYVANWIVQEAASGQASTTEQKSNRDETGDLKGKTIVIDPGHGGKDSGTIGAIGTLEKTLTIRTANLLADKLRAAGSNVIITRQNDIFITLQDRVDISNLNRADAFISIHYDSIKDSSVRGMTSYYYSSSQKELANVLHESIIESTELKDRGVRQNNYFVLRGNQQPATLLELGYLSNKNEEQLVSSQKYQETVSAAIYKGLENYFQ
ncbi:N-acetylmuramoyl-L-alanine amidase [Niallia circulans]|uniref:N-acetylmuramoyl-L-alanine amidase n=1 Tax=Niallia circulans TaxID=1397 RepID=A0A553SKG8_NIACI|nr:N-acetylmuramoyl-L-alanine amidase [Niallia circulans]TRZ37459.1 N-acetylmuramoyl-L-alanine amidase [Niallia circulans]